MSRLFWELRDVFRAAQRANVTIYTIDPGGLRAPVPGDLDPGRNKRDFLQVLAGETGGRTVVLHNEPQQRVPELFEENGAYYLIGFPPTEPFDGRYRHVRVRVNRDDVEVRTRTGYYAHRSLLDGSRVEVDGFTDTRQVDHTFTLPLAQLNAGPHLLVFEASIEDGPTVTRQIRFDVR
jgi:multidrug efflux pump subunit AcrA (membrane-fusion protein)